MTIERREVANHTFTPLPHYAPDESCSIHCQLQARALPNTWNPVGQGTIKGRTHSLHFMRTGRNVAFKALAGSLDAEDMLARRFDDKTIGAIAILGGLGYEADYVSCSYVLLEITAGSLIFIPRSYTYSSPTHCYC